MTSSVKDFMYLGVLLTGGGGMNSRRICEPFGVNYTGGTTSELHWYVVVRKELIPKGKTLFTSLCMFLQGWLKEREMFCCFCRNSIERNSKQDHRYRELLEIR